MPVGLGVDGAASNESSSLVEEVRHALLFARARGGPEASTVRDALELATIGGARVLGWDDQIGSLEAGKQADIALWRLDGLAHAGSSTRSRRWCSAPAAARAAARRRAAVVERDRLVSADEETAARRRRTPAASGC